jgi:hypothetical protein
MPHHVTARICAPLRSQRGPPVAHIAGGWHEGTKLGCAATQVCITMSTQTTRVEARARMDVHACIRMHAVHTHASTHVPIRVKGGAEGWREGASV